MSTITNKFRADVGIRLLHVVEGPIDYIIHYVKTTFGPPTNPGLLNEYCLNIFSDVVYYYNGASWIPTAIPTNYRFLFCASGDASSGCGNNIPNMYVYSWNGEKFTISLATDGVVALIRNASLGYYANSLITYDAINNAWITSAASIAEVDGRINSVFQAGEGISFVYDEELDLLRINCTLEPYTFDTDSFLVTADHVQISNIDGGTF